MVDGFNDSFRMRSYPEGLMSAASNPSKPGYHLACIEKGQLGELSKIKEEMEEALDAHAQNASVMVLVELSDLIGAVEAFLAKHHPSISLDDLRTFSAITKRAFENGRRS